MKDFTELPSAEAMDKEVGKFIKLAERHGFRPLFEKDDAEASMRKFRKCAEGIGNPKLGYVLSSVTFVKGPHNSLNHAVKMVFTNMAGGAM